VGDGHACTICFCGIMFSSPFSCMYVMLPEVRDLRPETDSKIFGFFGSMNFSSGLRYAFLIIVILYSSKLSQLSQPG
jgi:hypothetical protein